MRKGGDTRDENNKDTLQLCGFYCFLTVSQACSHRVPMLSSEQGHSEGVEESTGRSLCLHKLTSQGQRSGFSYCWGRLVKLGTQYFGQEVN